MSSFEPVAVDRPVEHHGRDHAGHAQAGDQRGRLAMAVRVAHPQPLAPAATAVAAGHVGRRPGLVDEHEPRRIKVELAVEPCLALIQDVGAVLLNRVPGLFLRVIPWRAKKRCNVEIATVTPASPSVSAKTAPLEGVRRPDR